MAMQQQKGQGGEILFTSEAFAEGCPDKVCDRIVDAVVDACLAQDSEARVACEACTKTSMVMVMGEVKTKASVNFEQVIREAVKSLGFDSEDMGLDWRTMNVIIAIEEHSTDLATAVGSGKVLEDFGCGEQGVVSGYATDETAEMMPTSHLLASRLCAQLDKTRKDGSLVWARPGGSAQVVVQYKEQPDGSLMAQRVKMVMLFAPRSADAKQEQCERDLMDLVVKKVIPGDLLDDGTSYRFVDPKQSSLTDVGMSGRQAASDTYGGWGHQMGASISGKDASRIHRSATYGARWAAVSLVAAQLCKRASVQLSYVPGSAEPTSIHVHSYGTARSPNTDAELADIVRKSFNFRPLHLQADLGLKTAQFQKWSAHGHFGRTDLDSPWEKPKSLK